MVTQARRPRERAQQNVQAPEQRDTRQRQPRTPPPPPPPPAGLYPDLGMRDETKEFSPLASSDRTAAVSGVVLHRTESPSMESTRNSYRTQMRNGNHVGAHYLIGQDGETSLTVPTDKVTAHVRGNKDPAWRGANARTIGIENVGMASQINPKGDIRKQVEALSLPPAMRARLLGMSDKDLKRTLADSGNEIHTDITGPQRRANWNLLRTLSSAHNLDMGTDVQAHETVDHKTLGEAEPIKEFVEAMRSWPVRLHRLEQRIQELEKDPSHDPKQVEAMRTVLQEEQTTWQAVQADKTPQENNQLEGERLLGQPGQATQREGARAQFYEQFWTRMQRVDRLLAPPAK